MITVPIAAGILPAQRTRGRLEPGNLSSAGAAMLPTPAQLAQNETERLPGFFADAAIKVPNHPSRISSTLAFISNLEEQGQQIRANTASKIYTILMAAQQPQAGTGSLIGLFRSDKRTAFVAEAFLGTRHGHRWQVHSGLKF